MQIVGFLMHRLICIMILTVEWDIKHDHHHPFSLFESHHRKPVLIFLTRSDTNSYRKGLEARIFLFKARSWFTHDAAYLLQVQVKGDRVSGEGGLKMS